MNRCLICFKPLQFTISKINICKECISKFEIINYCMYVEKCELLILYKYNDFFKELLYRYKGCYDYALKDAFFNVHLEKIKKKYRGRKIICAPSFVDSDKSRGFNHVKEIAKCLNLEIIDCLSKSKDYKQSDRSYRDRKEIKNIIKIDKTKLKGIKKVLIVDDVTTSLSTIKTIIRLIPESIDKKALVLASNCRFLKDKNI